MENLKYYLDIRHNFVLAYEKSVEFFVMYVPERKEWADCSISFSNFIHDYEFKEIGREDVLEKTRGHLPESMFQQYVATVRKNKG